ncbi:histone methylation protein DOT1 [Phlyctema vagabunda]|uniref:Histone-lysine N-methyltransferase, H3 lysine-79 specific n=1 Tax=Phlyctema vagabunda TaxID=108571 RepID=A0ABR4P359_9HELO
MTNIWTTKKTTTGLRPAAPRIRTEFVPEAPKAKPLPSKEKEVRALAARQRYDKPAGASSATKRQHAISSSATPKRLGVKRKPSRQTSPANPFSHDDDSSDDAADVGSPASYEKRQRRDMNTLDDPNRQICSRKAFAKESNLRMIHAADIQEDGHKSKYAVTGKVADAMAVELQYPSLVQRERYKLILANDNIDPFKEIISIAEIVAEVYLTPEEAKSFLDPDVGCIRMLTRAKNLSSAAPEDFVQAVEKYNRDILSLVRDGSIATNLQSMHHIPYNLVKRILSQAYDRTVSPKVELLSKYKNGTDEVYGELLAPLVHQLLAEVELKSDQVFVDLGSGVGNVVLQAALEFGCESWGCEMMQNAYELANAQKKEFQARCRLWGIAPGEVHLESANFLENKPIYEAMKRADVILINNHVFTPQTNRSLVDLFLDLKDGCKIISMKNFVPDDHVMKRNSNDPVNILDVMKKGYYYSDSVSWTELPGQYFIARKRSMIELA